MRYTFTIITKNGSIVHDFETIRDIAKVLEIDNIDFIVSLQDVMNKKGIYKAAFKDGVFIKIEDNERNIVRKD